MKGNCTKTRFSSWCRATGSTNPATAAKAADRVWGPATIILHGRLPGGTGGENRFRGGGGLAEGVGMGQQLGVQAIGVVATVVWSAVLTFIIVKITASVAGLRSSDDKITQGLDIAAHGESGYSL